MERREDSVFAAQAISDRGGVMAGGQHGGAGRGGGGGRGRGGAGARLALIPTQAEGGRGVGGTRLWGVKREGSP